MSTTGVSTVYVWVVCFFQTEFCICDLYTCFYRSHGCYTCVLSLHVKWLNVDYCVYGVFYQNVEFIIRVTCMWVCATFYVRRVMMCKVCKVCKYVV